MAASYPPIEDLALIGDCHSAALVTRDGGVEWCCFHRFDARPVFARLLDRQRGGHLHTAPVEDHTCSRRYLPGTNVLETTFETASGVVVVTDAFAVDEARADGSGDEVWPHMQLVRQITCTQGQVDVQLDITPRFDYGLTTPRMEFVAEGLAVVYGGADALVVESDLAFELGASCTARADAHFDEGDWGYLSVSYQWPHRLDPQRLGGDEVADRMAATCRFWQRWSGRIDYDGPHADAVIRSALVLKALTNAPTGAVVAAPTTSLPEEFGGMRNWDYRYTWLRDAGLILDALFALDLTDEGHAFMQWLEHTTAGRADDLRPLYGVGGERMLPEVTLDELDGYAGARPVRVGNAAAHQFQLDIYGALTNAVWRYHEHGGEVSAILWEFVCDIADTVIGSWTQPDAGIWELRDVERDLVSSKMFAWITLDRAVRLAAALDPDRDTSAWCREAERIRATVLDRGTHPDTGALTMAFDDQRADAATLLAGQTGFMSPTGATATTTLRGVRQQLEVGAGLVFRYRGDDGLPGDEGAFVICSFWMVSALARSGEHARARRMFEEVLSHANDVGLLAEQVDPATGRHLGNFPQAFSHAGLIGAALDLT